MHFISLVPLLASMAFAQQATTFVTGQLGDAVQNFDNPEGAAYRAIALPNAHNVSAMITAITARDGATEFAVDIDNLPTEGGPFCMLRLTRSVATTNISQHTTSMLTR